ncbi:MAG: hypothetical protein WC759_05650 [Candidatus Micrarchaeia archaeon]|jgi:hypothetical protein
MENENEFAFVEKRGFAVRPENVWEFAGYLLLLLFVPIIFGHSQGLPNQLFIGSVVNFLLALAAFRMSSMWKILPIVVVPTIGAYVSGIVFGSATNFLLYFIPAIWLGNYVYVRMLKNKSGVLRASLAKSALLFAVALVLVYAAVVPSLFLMAMGPLQLVTALIGGAAGMFAAGRISARK